MNLPLGRVTDRRTNATTVDRSKVSTRGVQQVYAHPMTAVALIFAGLAALLHVLFFKLESLDWKKPKTWKTFGLASQADADTTASLAFNQGFYNLFLAIGAGTGVALITFCDTRDTIGWTLIIFACASMLAASLVLLSTGKSYARAAAIQGGPALVAIVAAIVVIS